MDDVVNPCPPFSFTPHASTVDYIATAIKKKGVGGGGLAAATAAKPLFQIFTFQDQSVNELVILSFTGKARGRKVLSKHVRVCFCFRGPELQD